MNTTLSTLPIQARLQRSGLNVGAYKTLTLLTATALVAASHLSAQGPPPIALPGLNTGVSSSAAVALEELPVSPNASRFIAPEQLPEFVSKAITSMDIIARKTDPFGQVQDPEAKPAVVAPTITNRRPGNMKPTAFTDIISRIQINTVRPSENLFLIGTRPFKLGETFPLSFRGKKIQVKVAGVSAQKVDFENVETGEIASVKLSVMPAGMSSGNSGLSAPGMVPDDKAAPLQVEPASGF